MTTSFSRQYDNYYAIIIITIIASQTIVYKQFYSYKFFTPNLSFRLFRAWLKMFANQSRVFEKRSRALKTTRKDFPKIFC